MIAPSVQNDAAIMDRQHACSYAIHSCIWLKILLAAALLPKGLPHLIQLLQHNRNLIPEGSTWQLLLALHLLAELSNTGSVWQQYAQTLPVPVQQAKFLSHHQGPESPWVLFFRYVRNASWLLFCTLSSKTQVAAIESVVF